MENLRKPRFFYTYFKLFKFTFLFYFRKNISNLKVLDFYNYLQIIRFLLAIPKFLVFVPDWFEMKSSVFISFWVNGFITNYSCNKWFLIGSQHPKQLPGVLLNLTGNPLISREIRIKNNPTINFLLNSHSFYFDYFLKGLKGNLIGNVFDALCYFIVLLSFIFKLYHDV